ncbi:MAG: methyltransferase family protein [Nitrospinaceae bacterium]
MAIFQFLIQLNFGIFIFVFAWALIRNFNFNIMLVGLIYLAPLVPLGLTAENAERFLLVSFFNTIFGIIELVIFVLTVKPEDVTFDRPFWLQLLGHTLPIGAALIGLSFIARGTAVPVTTPELAVLLFFFIFGSALRVAAVYQLGSVAFKFDIAFRERQALKTDQLYGRIRHPSYTAMMMVVAAYAINTHSWGVGIAGLLLAWFGFQFRIYFEEKALADQFGEEYKQFRARTGMWFPRI